MMISLTTRLESYLAIRRTLGYDLSSQERVLRRFTGFADAQEADHVTANLFLAWKKHFGSANQYTWSHRLSMVRVFATWLQSVDPRNEVPPSSLIPGKYRRTQPYIYTGREIEKIVTEAAKLHSPYGMRGWTFSTLFGLIAVTGLRIREAIGLDDAEVDLDEGVLLIRSAKNQSVRLLPISPSTVNCLESYRTVRNRILPSGVPAFFMHERGRRLTDCCVRYNYARVCQRIGLRDRQRFHKHGQGPRIHDLRHTFAVRTIIDWYKKGLDPDREMIKLSTYLGHALHKSTYWYIEAVPELLRAALERAEQSITGGAI
jgi:integrase